MFSLDKDANYLWCDFSEDALFWSGYKVVSRLLRKEIMNTSFKEDVYQMSILFSSPSHDQEGKQEASELLD